MGNLFRKSDEQRAREQSVVESESQDSQDSQFLSSIIAPNPQWVMPEEEVKDDVSSIVCLGNRAPEGWKDKEETQKKPKKKTFKAHKFNRKRKAQHELESVIIKKIQREPMGEQEEMLSQLNQAILSLDQLKQEMDQML